MVEVSLTALECTGIQGLLNCECVSTSSGAMNTDHFVLSKGLTQSTLGILKITECPLL